MAGRRITLRQKTALAVSLLFLVFVIVLYLVARFSLMSTFETVEREDATTDVLRAVSALDRSVSELNTTAYDWSAWDDSYNFMADLNQDFIDINLVDTTYEGLRLNAMLFLDTAGEIAHGTGFDLVSGESAPIPPGLTDHIDCVLESQAGAGIVLVDDGPMLVAAQPILTSNAEGPARGMLLVARFLDDNELALLRGSTRLDFDVRLHGDTPEVDALLSEAEVRDGIRVAIRPLSSEINEGFALLEDIHGQPVLVLAASLPRDIYAQAWNAMHWFLVGLALAGAIFGALTMLVHERWILGRIKRIREGVVKIRERGYPAEAFALSGNDEISDLAGSMSEMVEALSRSHNELQEKEARYRLLAENSQDVILTADLDLNFTYISPSIKSLTGFEPDKAREMGLKGILTPEACLSFSKAVSGEIPSDRRGPRNWVMELQFVCKDGEAIWTEVKCSVLRDDGGKPVGVLGVARDIAERRKALGLLKGRLELERIGSTVASRFLQGMDFGKSVEDSLVEIAGYTNADQACMCVLQDGASTGGVVLEWHSPAVSGSSAQGLEDLCRAQLPWWASRIKQGPINVADVKHLEIRADAEREFFERRGIRAVLAYPLRMDKRLLGYIVCMKSVKKAWTEEEALLLSVCSQTLSFALERRRTEQELAESAAKYRNLVENTNDVIFTLDEAGRFTYVSPSVKAATGYTPEEMIGDSFAHYAHGDDLPIIVENLQKLRLGITEPHEFRIIDKEYMVHYVRAFSRPIFKDGEFAGVTSIAADITGRKLMEKRLVEYSADLESMVAERTRELTQAQERLVRNEKLAAIGELAGGISHELRTPLASIRFSIEFLRQKLGESADAKTLKHLDMLHKQIDACDRSLNDLLDFARPKQASRSHIRLEPVVRQIMDSVIVPANVEIRFDLDPEAPEVHVDVNHLEQIVRNLVTNAAQAMPDGGALSLRTILSDGFLGLEISDTGTGIPPENLDKIFEPLYTTKPRGIGLGLCVVKDLIERQEGRLRVSSIPGKGTTFTVEFPVTEKEEE